jgi:hypothetical protein
LVTGKEAGGADYPKGITHGLKAGLLEMGTLNQDRLNNIIAHNTWKGVEKLLENN